MEIDHEEEIALEERRTGLVVGLVLVEGTVLVEDTVLVVDNVLAADMEVGHKAAAVDLHNPA